MERIDLYQMAALWTGMTPVETPRSMTLLPARSSVTAFPIILAVTKAEKYIAQRLGLAAPVTLQPQYPRTGDVGIGGKPASLDGIGRCRSAGWLPTGTGADTLPGATRTGEDPKRAVARPTRARAERDRARWRRWKGTSPARGVSMAEIALSWLAAFPDLFQA